MRNPLIWFVLCGVSLAAQPHRDDKAASLNQLKAIIADLKKAEPPSPSLDRQKLETELVDTMMAIADPDRKPSRITVVAFAAELIGDLAGKEMANVQVDALEQSIGSVLTGSTTNMSSANRFRGALTMAGIDASKIRILTTRFIAIGEEVRGPDDSPANPIRGFK